MRTKGFASHVGWGLLTLSISAASFGLVHWRTALWPGPVVAATATAAPRPTGAQRLFVYVGSSTCKACAVPDLPETVRALYEVARAQAKRDGRALVSVGISVDLNVRSGLGHLDHVQRFDEVMTGQGWWNTGALKYVSGELSGPEATPQVIVLDRQLDLTDTSLGVTEEKVVARKVGYNSIKQWLAHGGDLAQ